MAIQSELNGLAATKSWDIVKLPKDKISIAYRWVYKVKIKLDGSVERFKSKISSKRFNSKRRHKLS